MEGSNKEYLFLHTADERADEAGGWAAHAADAGADHQPRRGVPAGALLEKNLFLPACFFTRLCKCSTALHPSDHQQMWRGCLCLHLFSIAGLDGRRCALGRNCGAAACMSRGP